MQPTRLLIGAFVLALGIAAVPMASANHSVCDNQPAEDISVGLVGVDTGLDGTGTHVCVGNNSYGVDTDPPEEGTGLVVEVLNCHGTTTPCPRLLEDTGVGVELFNPTVEVHIYVDGNEV